MLRARTLLHNLNRYFRTRDGAELARGTFAVRLGELGIAVPGAVVFLRHGDELPFAFGNAQFAAFAAFFIDDYMSHDNDPVFMIKRL